MRALLLLTTFLGTLITSAQVPDYIPANGLVAWYPFNGNPSDESGNGHDGTVEGAVLAADRFSNSNGAYFFDGDDRIFPANPEGYPLQERTTSIWMKSNVPVTGGRTLMGYGGSSCGNSWLLTYNNLGNQPYTSNAFEIQGHCNNNSVAAPLTAEEFTNWHLVVVRTSAAGTDVLIDGVLGEHSSVFIDDTAPGCAVFGGVPSLTGGCYYQDANVSLWNGWLDDIGIWNRALSDEEIEGLYNAPPPIAGCTDPDACNPDSNATLDDGSCEYGCLYCGIGTIWDPLLETCVAAPPELDTSGNCTLFNLQELAEGYQILLAANAELDSLLADCNGGSTSDQPSPCAGENVVTYHGYDYDIVEIGDQCWFAENCRYLPEVSPSSAGSYTQPFAYVHGYQGTSVENAMAQSEFLLWGALYNQPAAQTWACPTGWHTPSDEDWLVLEAFLDIAPAELETEGYRGTDQGDQLKSSPSSNPAWTGTDDWSFGALPGQYRSRNGHFGSNGVEGRGYYWSASGIDETIGIIRVFDGVQSGLYRGADHLSEGFSVRCVKD